MTRRKPALVPGGNRGNLARLTLVGLVTLLAGVAPVLAQTVPTPNWLARALTNRPQFAPTTNAPQSRPLTNAIPASAVMTTNLHVSGLTEQDVAMANAVIAENTLTLSLPGLGTSVDGPGPLTEADRLVLLALKFYHDRKALVPFGEFRGCLEALESRERYRQVAEEFWAWYREAAGKGQADQLGGYKSEFSTYIAMKNTARRKAANRVLAGQVESEAAWRRAVESDRKFREKTATREANATAARALYLEEWAAKGAEAAAEAERDWKAALGALGSHMQSPYTPGPHMRGR